MSKSAHPAIDDREPSGSQGGAESLAKGSKTPRRVKGDATAASPQNGVAAARREPAMRRVPQQARSQQTRQAVLAAAGEEISRAGLDNLSTRRIAAAAGLSIGGLYSYFPNKDSIVAALGEAWLENVFVALDEVHPRHGEIRDVFAYLREVTSRVLAVYESQPGLEVLFAAEATMPAMRELNDRHAIRVADSIGSALRHFAPRADEQAIFTTARTIPLVSHILIEAALTEPVLDRERVLRDLWVCVSALATSLLQA